MIIAPGALHRGATTTQKQYSARRVDSVLSRHSRAPHLVDLRAVYMARHANVPQLYRGGACARNFLSPGAQQGQATLDGIRIVAQPVGVRSVESAQSLTERIVGLLATYRAALRISLSAQRMYQMSMAGAMIVGVVSMSMIYRNLGTSAFADTIETEKAVVPEASTAGFGDASPTEHFVETQKPTNTPVKVVHNRAVDSLTVPQASATEDSAVVDDQKKAKSVDSAKHMDALPHTPLTQEAKKMVKGYPIEKMLPYILKQDPEVAKYLIAIAKQESQWGKRVPKLNGEDCYNYWGYRGQRARMGTGGHTCFDSPQDAVATVGKRLHTLIYDNHRTTAKKLVIWKCGTTCAGHDSAGVQRWIDVVAAYHAQLSKR